MDVDLELVETVGFVLGTCGNVVKGVPQLVRTGIRGRVEGLWAGAIWMAVVANVVWVCFGVAISNAAFVGIALFGLLVTAGTATRFTSRTGPRRNQIGLAAATLAACLGAALAEAQASDPLATVGVGLGLAMSLPQLLRCGRSDERRAGRLDDVLGDPTGLACRRGQRLSRPAATHAHLGVLVAGKASTWEFSSFRPARLPAPYDEKSQLSRIGATKSPSSAESGRG